MRILFRIEVTILEGRMTEDFAKKNPRISRTIEIRGDQTLEALHRIIFAAFDREEEHMYEFQVGGKRPMDRNAKRYGLDDGFDLMGNSAGDVRKTRMADLGLKEGEFFIYWFDFGDDWMHQIQVLSIGEPSARVQYPKITKRVGESPPQYMDCDEE